MAFDGAFLHCVKKELDTAVGSHIDKIYVISKDELLLVLRKKGFVKRLLLSCKGGMARIQFTGDLPENPEVPPMFCQLARKHFSAAYFAEIRLFGLERVIELCFEASNEMGDRVKLKIVCELIGGAANVILLDASGKIFDAMHRTDIEAQRLMMPGAFYVYPEPRGKMNLLECDTADIATAVTAKSGMLSAALLNTVEGLSPLICREIAFRAFGEDVELDNMVDIKPIIRELQNIKNDILSGGTPTMLSDQSGKPVEFTFTDITQYGNTLDKKIFSDYGQLLDAFYSERERISRIIKAGGDSAKLVSTLLSRAKKRMNVRKEELRLCENREHLRICGELLKANMHNIKSGATHIRVQNFYDPNMAEIEIRLDPALSPQNNAAKYFKEYKKSYIAEQSLSKLIEDDCSEIEYLESVEEALSRADTLSAISEIREELTAAGYIKAPQKRGIRKKNTPKVETYEYGGFKIAVGKNNIQNDYLTCTLAKKGDLWFHTKKIHGAHVVIFCGGRMPDGDVILFAARLAAKNSKASGSSNVPVDYTDIKYVKKPAGAKAGMVIYTTNKTVFVTPEEDL